MKTPLAFFLAFATIIFSQEREHLSLSIYNDNLGVVRDVRKFSIEKGLSIVRLTDVSSQIDATTVHLKALKNDASLSLIEQNYEYDLVSASKLLQKYVDKNITLIGKDETKISGTLLSSAGDIVLRQAGGNILMIPNLNEYRIDVPSLPEGLITRPTLVWKLRSEKSLSSEPLEVTYQTTGLQWHAEYVAVLNKTDDVLDLNSWVTLENTTATRFPDAHVKFIAGKINRAQKNVPQYGDIQMMAGRAMRSEENISERGLFEYHLYDLGIPTTIESNSSKQLALFSAEGMKAKKVFTFGGGNQWMRGGEAQTVNVSIEFENSEKNNLGKPMPEGVVRLYKADQDGSLEFIGEDRISHTPRDEKVTLRIGAAFDVLAERVVKESRRLSDKVSEEVIEVKVKNKKDEDVVVNVLENIYGDWKISDNNMPFEKRSAYLVNFPVAVGKRSEKTLRFTITRY